MILQFVSYFFSFRTYFDDFAISFVARLYLKLSNSSLYPFDIPYLFRFHNFVSILFFCKSYFLFQAIQIKSAVAPEGLKGYVYIEAYKQSHLKNVCSNQRINFSARRKRGT